MPKEGENILSFENFKKQMKMPFIIYADFEAIIRKILGCERERMQTSYTEKTEKHEACGYSYLVVRSDGKVVGSNMYRGENAVGEFLSAVLQKEEKIRESLATPKPIDMACKDWEKFKNAKDCQKRFAFRSDQVRRRKALLHAVLNRVLKSRLAGESQKILQRCERQADKDRDAEKGGKHPFFPKLQKTDEGAFRYLRGH